MKKILILILLLSCNQELAWHEYPQPWRLFLGTYTVENINVNISPSDQSTGAGIIETWPEQETLAHWRLEGKIFQIENWNDDHNGVYEVTHRDQASFTITNDSKEITFTKIR